MTTAPTDPLLTEVREAAEVDDATSARVLDAALDRFTTFGVRRTTMDDIASAAGVGRATVYRRFAGRDEIVRAVILREMARFIGEVDTAVQAIEDPLERFVEGFVATLREAREHPLLRRLLDVEPDLLLPYLTVQGAPALSLSRAYLSQEFRASQRDGHIRDDVDVQLVAEMLVRLCQSLLLTPDGVIELDDDAGLRRLARDYLAPALFTNRA
jgi:AcrR family transcriptional regulator